jgi:hypothetical protein
MNNSPVYGLARDGVPGKSILNLGIPTPPSTSGDIDPKIKSLVGPKKYVSMTFRTSLMDLLVMARAKKFIYDIKLACKG